jgi:death-on-curing protein
MFDPYDPTDGLKTDGGEGIDYPSVSDIYRIHKAVIENDEQATEGVVNDGQVENALSYIEHGHFGQKPESLFEKAAELFVRIVRAHEFADGNKRTASYSALRLIRVNGYPEVNTTDELADIAERIAAGEDIPLSKVEEVLRDTATDT